MELLDLAQNNFGNTRSGSLAGPVGGFIVAALAVVTILLIRNMNTRIRRLPARFPTGAAPADGAPSADAGTTSAEGTEAGATGNG